MYVSRWRKSGRDVHLVLTSSDGACWINGDPTSAAQPSENPPFHRRRILTVVEGATIYSSWFNICIS